MTRTCETDNLNIIIDVFMTYRGLFAVRVSTDTATPETIAKQTAINKLYFYHNLLFSSLSVLVSIFFFCNSDKR